MMNISRLIRNYDLKLFCNLINEGNQMYQEWDFLLNNTAIKTYM